MPKAKKSKVSNTKAKTKAKRKYARKMLYKCLAKNERNKMLLCQEPNEHGAYNNVYKNVPYVELTFQKFVDLNKPLQPNEDIPLVINAIFILETCDKSIVDKYIVGEDYKELPINV